jgi:translation initiation factor 2 beta subunit (eIF-2beta)/eIF-5
MGLLPCVLRSVTSFLHLDEEAAVASSGDGADGTGVVIEAMSASSSSSSSFSSGALKNSRADLLEYVDSLLWTESVFGLTMNLISLTTALPALTDNGVISSIASLLGNKPKKTESYLKRFSGSDVTMKDIEHVGIVRVHIDSLVVQILDTAITNHSGAFVAFKERGGAESALVRLTDELEMLSCPSFGSMTSLKSAGQSTEAMEVADSCLSVPSDGAEGEKEGEEAPSSSSAVLTMTSSEAMAALLEGKRWKLSILPAANKVLLHQLLALVISWVQDTQQDSGDHLHGQLLKGALFARIFGVIFSNVTILSSALISPTVALIADIINNDPAPPGLLGHMLSSGIVDLALRACLNTSLEFNSDLLMSLSSLISACCLTQEGIDIVKDINPFPHLFSLLLDEKYYYPYSKMFMTDLPNNFGSR